MAARLRMVLRASLGSALQMLALALIMTLALPLHPGWAVQPDEVLADPALETRARDLSRDLRCLVCQNQSIDDSNAPLARDLRLLVRERLQAGDSDNAVMAYLTARYGDFVLLKPPFQENTLLLWLGPLVVLLAGAGGILAWYRSQRGPRREAVAGASGETPLSADERERLVRVLAEADEPKT